MACPIAKTILLSCILFRRHREQQMLTTPFCESAIEAEIQLCLNCGARKDELASSKKRSVKDASGTSEIEQLVRQMRQSDSPQKYADTLITRAVQ